MRLIDADVLKQELRKHQIESLIAHTENKNVFDIINEQDTVYDVDKVVNEIRELSYKWLSEIRARDAIHIIRHGGIQ